MNLRSILAVAGTVAFFSVLGGEFGDQLGSASLAIQKTAVEPGTRELVRVLGAIEIHYPDPAAVRDAIYGGALPAMLEELDPHSMFFDPEAYGRLREEQRGSYVGVGMAIRQFGEETIVDYPFPESPAFRQGGGLVSVLVLISGVALLFTKRYPPDIFDFVMGLNRWAYRVAAYVLLMTDRYPPFRLDMRE